MNRELDRQRQARYSATDPTLQLQPERVTRLHVASATRPVGDGPPDVMSEEGVKYRTGSEISLSINKPILDAAMVVLEETWPATVPFAELLRRSRELLGTAADPNSEAEEVRGLTSALVNGYLSSERC